MIQYYNNVEMIIIFWISIHAKNCQRVQLNWTRIQINVDIWKYRNYEVRQVDTPLHWQLVLNGPKESPYEGGMFKVDVKFPSEYPFRFPSLRFLTPIYHPGV